MACFDDLSFITQVSTRIITSNEIKLKLIKHDRKYKIKISRDNISVQTAPFSSLRLEKGAVCTEILSLEIFILYFLSCFISFNLISLLVIIRVETCVMKLKSSVIFFHFSANISAEL